MSYGVDVQNPMPLLNFWDDVRKKIDRSVDCYTGLAIGVVKFSQNELQKIILAAE